MNGIIHPCSHPMVGKTPETEEEMIDNVLTYIDRLVKMTLPQNLLFLAVDGVAPRAKMNQQRARRFVSAEDSANLKTIKDEEFVKLKELLGDDMKAVKPSWDHNVITPGTKFMKKVADALLKHAIYMQNTDSDWKKFKVIVSDASIPGEGEHKLLNHIREQKKSPQYNPELVHCIHGADADLVMLGLLTHEKNFFILRERFDPEVDFMKKDHDLVDLSMLRECLSNFLEDIRPYMGDSYDATRIIDDFIFIFFLVGNDFIPHLPGLDISSGALDILIDIYKINIAQIGGYLTQGTVVHVKRVMEIFRLVSMIETDVFFQMYVVKKGWHDRDKKQATQYFMKEAIWRNKRGDLGKFLSEFAMRKAQKFELKQEPLPDFLNRKDPNWKTAYYAWKLDVEKVDVPKTLEELCFSYVEGLIFVWKYYTEGNPSWSYYYPFHYAPFPSDIAKLKDTIFTRLSKLKFDQSQPFKPFDQLMSVLPRKSSHALPPPFAKEMLDVNSPLAEIYPDHFKKDLNGKSKVFKAVILLPFINAPKLQKVTAMLEKKLNKEDAMRNAFGTPQLTYFKENGLRKNFERAQTSEERVSVIATPELSGKIIISDTHPKLGDKFTFGEKSVVNNVCVCNFDYPKAYGKVQKKKREDGEESSRKKVKTEQGEAISNGKFEQAGILKIQAAFLKGKKKF